MKKFICSLVLVAMLVAAVSPSVMAGKYWDKRTSSFSFSSACISHVEAATVSARNGVVVYTSFSVKTNKTGKTYCSGRLGGSKTVTSPWALFWSYASKGYVNGMVDKTDVTHTDYN